MGPLVHPIVPACRHAAGTISWSSVLDLWRMASEDSDQLMPGLLAIHRLNDFRYVRETLVGLVGAFVDEVDARSLKRGDKLHQGIDVAADDTFARLHALNGGERQSGRRGQVLLVHAHEGSGVIHCENPQIIVYTSHHAKPHYKLDGCRRISFYSVGY